MDRHRYNSRNFIAFILCALLAFMTSCTPEPGTGKRAASGGDPFGLSGGGDGSGNLAGPGDDDFGNGIVDPDVTAKVEIRHLVNPRTGAFVRKLTIPKNFSGRLYLSGLNIASLTDRHISVKFYFGNTREPVEIPAVVARAPGITPTTDIEVLILDMDSKPFENIRLLYDLYDYNTYDFDNPENESPSDEPAIDNLNDGLYCRALLLDDDPTFRPNGNGEGCDADNPNCLYAYAKIKDRGLYDATNEFQIFPTEAQIDHEGKGYYSDESVSLAKRCLPDNVSFVDGEFDETAVNVPISETYSFDSYMGSVEVGEDETTEYQYLGSYLNTNTSLWQIGIGAMFGEKGLYRLPLTVDDEPSETEGQISNMFPRYIKRNLNAGVEHLSSERPNGFKEVLPFPSNGETLWMDGCSERVTTLNAQTNEHIGSCSVTAVIEIIAKDPKTGNKEIVAGRGDGGVDVKLQLVRASGINNVGEDVLFTSLRSCPNSSACGANECCFNQKCWSKEIVSACIEDTSGTGGAEIGATCTTDFECASLCCNKSIGKCQVHDTTQDPPVLCSKPAGQQCIAKEWCAQSVVTEYFIVKTGVDESGKQLCALRGYNRLKYGDCLNGLCVPPTPPDVPVFNPADPTACDNAIDPPSE